MSTNNGIGIIPERFLRNDEEFTAFVVDSKPVKLRMLSANRAETWCDEHRDRMDAIEDGIKRWAAIWVKNEALREEPKPETKVDPETAEVTVVRDAEAVFEMAQTRLEEARKKTRALQGEKIALIRSRLAIYDPERLTSEVLDSATTPQLLNTWETLRNYNDPFYVAGFLAQARQEDALAEIREVAKAAKETKSATEAKT